MTPDELTAIVLGVAVGWVLRSIKQTSDDAYRRRATAEYRARLKSWEGRRQIFGLVDPSSGVYLTGVFAGKPSDEVMARLRHPAPEPPACS